MFLNLLRGEEESEDYTEPVKPASRSTDIVRYLYSFRRFFFYCYSTKRSWAIKENTEFISESLPFRFAKHNKQTT